MDFKELLNDPSVSQIITLIGTLDAHDLRALVVSEAQGLGLNASEVQQAADILPSIVDVIPALALIAQVNSEVSNGHWQNSETLYAQIVPMVKSFPFLQWTILLGLASVKKMLGKDKEAMVIYIKLMSLSSDPSLSEQLRENIEAFEKLGKRILGDRLFSSSFSDMPKVINQSVALAFCGFVEVGSNIPDFSLSQLHQVLDEGLDWITAIGHPEWGHMFHTTRASLFSLQNRTQEALDQELVALAMRQADPDGLGYAIAVHLCEVGGYLNNLERFDESIIYLGQVIYSIEASLAQRTWAFRELGYAYLGKGSLELAEDMAYKTLKLAQQQDVPAPLRQAYSLLSLVSAKEGKIQEASRYAACMWFTSQNEKSIWSKYHTQLRCSNVRLEQARVMLKLRNNVDKGASQILSADVPLQERRLAYHYALSAQRWLVQTLKLAKLLDAQASTHMLQEEVDKLMLEVRGVQSSYANI